MKPNNLLDDLNEIDTTKEKLAKVYIVFLVVVGLLLLIGGFFFYYGINTLGRERDEENTAMEVLIDSLLQAVPDTTYVDTVR